MDKGHDEEESLPLAQQAVAGRNGVPPTGDQKKPAPRDAGWVNARLLPRGRRSLAGGYSSSRLRRYVKVRNETGAPGATLTATTRTHATPGQTGRATGRARGCQ